MRTATSEGRGRRVKRRSLLVLALALAHGAAVARTSEAQDARLLTIRDDAVRDLVRQQVDGARARGFTTPFTEPLVSKALEGVAMRATPKEIRRAMDALEKRMRDAARLLAPNPTVDEVAAGADALAFGVPAGALKDMRRLAPKRSVTIEIGVLTELVLKGVSPKRAVRMVTDLMARGATGAQLTELNSAVQRDVAAGLKPDEALQLLGRGVMSLLPPPPSVTTAQPRQP